MLTTILTAFVGVILCLGVIIIVTSKASEAKFGLGLLVFLIILAISWLAIFSGENDAGNVTKGEYYSTQCRIIEANIDEGVILKDTHKLKCGDVIEYVSVDDYQDAVKAYKNRNDNVNMSANEKANINAVK